MPGTARLGTSWDKAMKSMAKNQGYSINQATAAILGRGGAAVPHVRDFWDTVGESIWAAAEVERQAAEAQAQALANAAAAVGKLGGYKEAYQAFQDGKLQKGHNDLRDAMRHAETSRNVSNAMGEVPAHILGTVRELWETYVERAPRDEMDMDLHNNAEGRVASRERRPVDPRNLQPAPVPRPHGMRPRY